MLDNRRSPGVGPAFWWWCDSATRRPVFYPKVALETPMGTDGDLKQLAALRAVVRSFDEASGVFCRLDLLREAEPLVREALKDADKTPVQTEEMNARQSFIDAALAQGATQADAEAMFAAAQAVKAQRAMSPGLRDLLTDCRAALRNWVRTYAPEQCTDEAVQKAQQEIADGGGTLAYAAKLSARIQKTLGPWRTLDDLGIDAHE